MKTETVTTGRDRKKVPAILTEFSKQTEESLLKFAKKGESAAFGILCERYSKQLFRAANRVTRNREDAEDAVQTALLNAFLHFADFDGRSSFSTWLTRIVINSSLMLLRKRKSAIESASESTHDSEVNGEAHQIRDNAPTPERRYAQSEEKEILDNAIQKLRPSLQ